MLTLGGCRILRELDPGGGDVAYLGTDPSAGRTVVIVANSVNRYYRRDEFLADLRAAAGDTHPNIAALYGSGTEQEVDYAVMEYVGGRTLRRILADETPQAGESLRILAGLADALDYLHRRRNAPHDGVRPACITIRDDGVAKLACPAFAGLECQAYELAPHTVRPEWFECASPEQVRGEPRRTGRSDQFSLAATAYRLMTGRSAFTGANPASLLKNILTEEPAAPHSLNPELSLHATPVLYKAMAKDPARRYNTCSEFVEALHAACGG